MSILFKKVVREFSSPNVVLLVLSVLLIIGQSNFFSIYELLVEFLNVASRNFSSVTLNRASLKELLTCLPEF